MHKKKKKEIRNKIVSLQTKIRHMITQIRGRLVEKHPTEIVVECNGVGYLLHISLNTFSSDTFSSQSISHNTFSSKSIFSTESFSHL